MPIKVLRTDKVVSFKHYDVRHEVWVIYPGDEEHIVISAYSKQGYYVGAKKDADRLIKKYGIVHFQQRTEESAAVTIGYSHLKKKWYGWSHRAIFGFKPGSKCKKGNSHYLPATYSDAFQKCDHRHGPRCWAKGHIERVIAPLRYPTYGGNAIVGFEDQIASTFAVKEGTDCSCCAKNCPLTFGKGEWTAETWVDAKQMAIDFAKSVS
jgi:hypothetical protein